VEVAKETDNAAGTVHIAFIGLPDLIDGSHIPPYGIGRLLTVNFNATFEYIGYPPPTASIYLKNPLAAYNTVKLDADAGIIDLTAPVSTVWTELSPAAGYGTSYSLNTWADNDGDGQLSAGDEM